MGLRHGNNFALTVLGSTLEVRINVYRRQILTTKVDSRTVTVKPYTANMTKYDYSFLSVLLAV